ncbi:MAG TPA: hypothetical protein VIY48_22380 [Candidatus Paceibacterota bacterium]
MSYMKAFWDELDQHKFIAAPLPPADFFGGFGLAKDTLNLFTPDDQKQKEQIFWGWSTWDAEASSPWSLAQWAIPIFKATNPGRVDTYYFFPKDFDKDWEAPWLYLLTQVKILPQSTTEPRHMSWVRHRIKN